MKNLPFSALFCGILLGILPTGLAFGQTENPPRLVGESTVVTTTLTVSICGDAIVQEGELCDDGLLNGTYSSTTAGRYCGYGCHSWAPYCGDSILNPAFGEVCDEGAANGTTNGRCSADCRTFDNTPSTGGGYPGSGGYSPGSSSALPETRLVIQGVAYPGAIVTILKDGSIAGTATAGTDGSFAYSTNQITPGVTTVGYWAQDQSGLKSAITNTTLTIVANAITTISGAHLPPTITATKRTVKKGEDLNLSGSAAPAAMVSVYVDGKTEPVASVKSAGSGVWNLILSTNDIADGDHYLRAASLSTSTGNQIKSPLSQQFPFVVGNGKSKFLSADLNRDNKVNLADFSMLLFYWGSRGPTGDINEDSKVNLADFSIMLSQWTG